MKIHIVLPVAFNYNDQYYYPAGDYGEVYERGNEGFFFSKEEADKHCEKLNKEARSDSQENDYEQPLEEIDFYKVLSFESSASIETDEGTGKE